MSIFSFEKVLPVRLGSGKWLGWLAVLLVSSIIWAQPMSGGPRVPSVLLMLLGGYLLVKGKFSFHENRWQQFVMIMACFWLPALFSLPDSFAPYKTGELLVLLPLYLLFAAAVFYLLDYYVSLQHLMAVFTLVSLLWIADALYQLYMGHDVLGIPARAGRIVGPFAYHLRLSLMLAIVSPLVLYYLQRYGWLVQSLYMMAALTIAMLSGVRTDMLTLLLAVGLYLVSHQKGWLLFGVIPLLLLAGMFASQHSGVAKYKLHTFNRLPETYQQWNRLSSYRLDIWYTAWNMLKAHPVNGVGARSFRYAYNEHKTKDNVFDEEKYEAAHAHHPLISIAAETGLIGIAGMAIAALLLLCWGQQVQGMVLWQNPWLQVLILMVFPVQSMPILFSLWWFPVVSLAVIGYLHSIQAPSATPV